MPSPPQPLITLPLSDRLCTDLSYEYKMYKTVEKAAAKVKQFRRIKEKVNFQAECQYQTLLARDHYVTTSIYIHKI